jgi:hypothetical protein
LATLLWRTRAFSTAQLGLDDLDVGDGVHLASHVDDVLVLEAAHHVDDGIGLADVAEELVAQALALAGAGHQAGDVHELHDGWYHAFGLDDGGQLLQARIWKFHHAHVGLDGAEGVVLGRDAGFGQCVEEGRLADVGQADDAALEAHGGGLSEGGAHQRRRASGAWVGRQRLRAQCPGF